MKSRIQYYALTTLHLDPTQARYERLRQCKQLPKAGYYTTLATATKQWPIFRITVNKMRKKGKEVLFISGRQSEQVGIIGHCYEEDSISDPVMEFVMDPHHVQFQMLYYSSQETKKKKRLFFFLSKWLSSRGFLSSTELCICPYVIFFVHPKPASRDIQRIKLCQGISLERLKLRFSLYWFSAVSSQIISIYTSVISSVLQCIYNGPELLSLISTLNEPNYN